MWQTIVRRYWQVALMKETPANTPYSPLLLAGVTILFFSAILLQFVAMSQESLTFDSFVTAASLIVAYYLYTFFLLKLNNASNRSVQVITTLIGVHLIIHLISFPLLLLVPFFAQMNVYPKMIFIIGIVYLVCTVCLTVWQFLATAFIYRNALEIEFLPSLLASFGLFAFMMLVVLFW